MSNNNQSDIQLRIIAAIDGLVDISKLITEVDKLGGQTTESSVEVEKLVSDLDKLRQQDQLISKFQQLKKSTSDLGGTLDDARTRATALGKGLSDSKSAVAATNSEYKASMSVTQQLSNEWVQAKAKVDLLSSGIKNAIAPTREQRDELKKAKDEAKALGEQYRASSRETSTLASALRSTESAVTKQTKEFNSARKEVNQLDAQYIKQNATLNALRTSLQQTGINTTQLVSEQAKLKSSTAQAEIGVKNLSASLTEQAALHKYLKESVDLSGASFKKNAAESKKLAAAHSETSVASNGFASTVSGLTSRLLAMAGAYVGINTITSAIKEMFSQGNQAELLQIQMNAVMGSIQAGEQATAWIQRFAKDTPLQLDQVTEAFTTMKSFGLDPMDGSLQAVVDQSYKLGKGFEGVQRISLALGQAWGKQKLQGDEILQLIQAGVPVWDMLAAVTGKNTQELEALSSKGALGRDVIKQLMDEIAKGSSGAAAANMGTLSGLISNAKDNIDAFYRMVANSGSLDWLKQQLQAVNEKFAEMTADGSLKAWAKEISDDIVAVGNAIKSGVQSIWEWRDSIITAGQVWASLKVASWANDVLKYKNSWQETAKSIDDVNKRAPLLALLKHPVVAFGVALASASTLALDLAKDIFDLTEGQAIKNRIAEQERALNQQLITQGNELMAQNAKNNDLQYQSADVIKYMSDADRERYSLALEGNKNYLAGQLQVNMALENAGLLTEEQKKQTQFAIAAMRQAFADFAAGERLHLEQASKSIDDYVADIEHAKSVSEGLANTSLSDVFKTAGLDFEQISGRVGTTVQSYISGLQQMEQATSITGPAINAYLSKAFDSAKNQTELDGLISKITTLHNQGKLVGDDYISSLGAAANAAKSLSATNLDAGQQYIDLLKQQKQAAEEAYKTTGLEQYKVKSGELTLEIDKATKAQQKNKAASGELEQAYSDLGMKSAAALEDLATKSEVAYSKISTSGSASLDSQKEAFLKFAEAEIQAAEASGRVPSAMLQSQAAALGLTAELEALNTKLTTVGGDSLITASALNQLGDSATDAGDKVASVGTATEGTVTAVSELKPLVAQISAETINLGKASEYAGMSAADLTAEIESQSTAYQRFLANARDQMSGIGTVSGDFLYSIQTQTAATHQYYVELAQSTLAVKNLQTALSETPSDALINQAEHALSKYKELGEENLSGLRSAIDSAKSKMDSLNASTQSTLNSLRDQADELSNNTAAIENRRYETQVADLQAKLAEAQNLQNTKSIADMREALSLAQEIHNQKLATIKAEADAAAAEKKTASTGTTTTSAATNTSSSTSSKSVTVNLKLGTTNTAIQLSDESQVNNLLSVLEQAGMRTS